MPTFVIDSAALSRNMEKLRRFTSAQIIAVVKGNGYGLGLVSYARFLTAQGVALLAVSTVEEAAALRDAGITAQLLMLSSTALPEEIAALLTRDVILTVGSADAARAVSDAAAVRGVTARVHVKLDTGMGRYGFLPQETAEAAALLQALPALQVEGVFTHLSDAANAKCTALQYRRFTEGVRILQEAGIDTGLRHVCASTAFLRYPEMHLDAVRLGSALLGRLSVPDTLGLERIGWLEAQVTELKTLPAGWPVGYTGAYRTRRETRLALLPVGYTSGVGVPRRPAPAGSAAAGAARRAEAAARRRPDRTGQRLPLSGTGRGRRHGHRSGCDGCTLRRGRHGAYRGAAQVRGQRRTQRVPIKKEQKQRRA